MSKKDIVKYIIDEYGVTAPTDITNALKDLLGETLQDMLNSEFDEHMGYDKYDQKTDKTNYRNGTSKKTVKTSQGKSRRCAQGHYARKLLRIIYRILKTNQTFDPALLK